jgi:hypothetical protein
MGTGGAAGEGDREEDPPEEVNADVVLSHRIFSRNRMSAIEITAASTATEILG